MKFKFNFKGKNIVIDLRECRGIMQGIGLMFKGKETDALLFEMKDKAIHSFFCPRFLAIWLDDKNRIVDYNLVSPWKSYVKPQKSFSKLIEIPVGKRYESILKAFKY